MHQRTDVPLSPLKTLSVSYRERSRARVESQVRAADARHLDTLEAQPRRHSLDFLIRIGCRTKHNPSELTRIPPLRLRSQVSGAGEQWTSGSKRQSRLVIFRFEGQTLHPRQLQVSVPREHPEVVRKIVIWLRDLCASVVGK